MSKEKSNSNQDLLEATLSYTLSEDEGHGKSGKVDKINTKMNADKDSTEKSKENKEKNFKRFYEEMNLKLLKYKK